MANYNVKIFYIVKYYNFFFIFSEQLHHPDIFYLYVKK